MEDCNQCKKHQPPGSLQISSLGAKENPHTPIPLDLVDSCALEASSLLSAWYPGPAFLSASPVSLGKALPVLSLPHPRKAPVTLN